MAGTRGKVSSLGNIHGVRNGSPSAVHSRRTSNPFMRPRKQFRRSLSMFETTGDSGSGKEVAFACPTLQSVMDLEEPYELVLPHFFPEDECDNIPRITRETMIDVLDGKYSDKFDQKMIIDCRFEYEYEGGHIDGAINYNDKELLASQLIDNPMEGRTLLIFHCEYSAHRAPIMARHIRARDRNENAAHYPKLYYPEIYILDGGYSAFFAEYRERCSPQAYVEMNAAEHVNTCEREMGRLRQNRRGFSRAQTYAFGDRSPGLQDSPTAPSRITTRDREFAKLLGTSPSLCGDRGGRRMVSF
jgi:M-phase inducer tyrosine phosphatase